jgi:hypothetical protein
MFYTTDLANLAVTAATGVVQSFRATPIICNEFGSLLVDISGQDVRVTNLQDISGINVVTDISGQTVLVGNFPAEQVVDVSGVVVTSSQHLNNLNATYSAGAVVGNITLVNGGQGNNGKVVIDFNAPIVFVVGQQVVIAGATTFPQLNGVKTIAEINNTSSYIIYFSDFPSTDDNDIGETGTISSYGSSPLQTDASGNLLVKVEGTAAVSIAGDVTTIVKPTTLAYRNIATSNTGQVVSAVPATIRQFCAQNSAATNQYVKLYNKATAPSSADTPIFTFLLGSATGIVANVIK